MEALKKHHIDLTGWWFPGALNDEARADPRCHQAPRHDQVRPLGHGRRCAGELAGGTGGARATGSRPHQAHRARGREARRARRALQSRLMVRRTGEHGRHLRGHEAGRHDQRRHRLQPASWPRPPRKIPGRAAAHAAASDLHQPQRHDRRRRSEGREDSAAGTRRSRLETPEGYRRERLSRPHRHPQSHQRRRRRPAARQPRRPRVAGEAARRQGRRVETNTAHVEGANPEPRTPNFELTPPHPGLHDRRQAGIPPAPHHGRMPRPAPWQQGIQHPCRQ